MPKNYTEINTEAKTPFNSNAWVNAFLTNNRAQFSLLANELNIKNVDFNLSDFYNEYTKSNDTPNIVGNFFKVPRIIPIGSKFNQLVSELRYLESLIFAQWVRYYNIPQSVLDIWNQEVLDTVEKKKSFWRKIKEQFNNFSQGIINDIKNIDFNINLNNPLLKKMEESFNKFFELTKQIPYAPLIPYKLAMLSALNRRGIATNGQLNDVVNKFHSHIVKGQQVANLDPNFSDALLKTLTPENITAVTGAVGSGGGIVKDILNFFLSIFNKKTLSTEEQKLTDDVETGFNDPSNDPDNNDNDKGKGLIKIIGLMVAIFFLIKFFAKK